jgi:hypothetical protein
MLNDGGRSVTHVLESWNHERVNFLRNSAADIKSRAAALGQWRAAFDCSYFNWSTSRTA